MSSPNLPSPYRNLQESDEIRLLHLLPSQESDKPIKCTFKHCRLAEKAAYEVVSYTWGAPTPTHPVYIVDSDSTVDVTENCLSLLRYLRKPNEPRVLWVDAICINQSKNDEKAHQVGIMGHIYASAKKTLIFLQEAGPEVNRCWASSTTTDRVGTLDAAAKRELLDNPWFHRAWIIQETLLSPSKSVICPPFEFDFEELYDLGESEVLRMNEDYWSNKNERPNTAWQEGGTEEKNPGDVQPIKALDYFIEARNFGCQMYHDKVYSLLSLFHPRILVPIDYTLTKEQVYKDFTGGLIEAGDSRFLFTAHRQSLKVDWDKASSDLVGDDIGLFAFWRSINPAPFERQWSALGWMTEPNGSWIRALGFSIGSVTKASTSRLTDEPSAARKQWNVILAELSLPSDENESGLLPAVHLQKRNRANVAWYNDWVPDVARHEKEPSEDTTGLTSEPGASAAFFRGRPLFLCGDMLGLGPQDLQIGDQLWYVAGFNVPFCVLRETNGGKDKDNMGAYGGLRCKAVGLCFFGLNDNIPAVKPMANTFPTGGPQLLEIE